MKSIAILTSPVKSILLPGVKTVSKLLNDFGSSNNVILYWSLSIFLLFNNFKTSPEFNLYVALILFVDISFISVGCSCFFSVQKYITTNTTTIKIKIAIQEDKIIIFFFFETLSSFILLILIFLFEEVE